MKNNVKYELWNTGTDIVRQFIKTRRHVGGIGRQCVVCDAINYCA